MGADNRRCTNCDTLAAIERQRAALIVAGSWIGRDCPEAERTAVLEAISEALDA